jgi:hypothetical protein
MQFHSLQFTSNAHTRLYQPSKMTAYNERFCAMAGGKCCVEARVVKRPPLRKAAAIGSNPGEPKVQTLTEL